MRLRLRLGSVRRKAKVDGDRALVGDDVAGHSPADADRIEAFAVGQTLDLDRARLVGDQPLQHRCGGVDRVLAEPRTGAVRAASAQPDVDTQRSLAAALDQAGRPLEDDRQVGGQHVGALAGQPAQAVAVGGDLFAVVEHPGQVDARIERPGPDQVGDPQLHRDPGFHVGRPAAEQPTALDTGGDVSGDRHGVEVPGQRDPLRAAPRRAGEHHVAVALDVEQRIAAERRLDEVGQVRLVAGHRLDVDQGGRQRGAVAAELKHARHATPHPIKPGRAAALPRPHLGIQALSLGLRS